MAGGLAASSPLTWHVVLRFTGAGRDHIEDLGGTSVSRAVGSLGDSAAAGRPGPRRAGHVLTAVLVLRVGISRSGVLASERWGNENKK